MEQKKYRDIKALREYLISNKNIVGSNNIDNVLRERSYISVINSNKRFFATDKNTEGHIYPSDVNFDEYINLVKFDDEISNELYYSIGLFERKLKNTISHTISNNFMSNGDDCSTQYIDTFQKMISPLDRLINRLTNKHHTDCGFLNVDFMYKKNGLITKKKELTKTKIAILKKIIRIGTGKEKSKNQIIKHYQKKEKRVPFWLVVHALSFGELQVLYNLCGKEMRETIYCSMQNVPIKSVKVKKLNQFSGRLEDIRKIRNCINHYEPVIPLIVETSISYTIYTVLDLLKNVKSQSTIANIELQEPIIGYWTFYSKKRFLTLENVKIKLSK